VYHCVCVCVCVYACARVSESACVAPICAPARKPRRVRARRPRPQAPASARCGGAAHRSVSAVSAESDAGTIPVIALLYKALRSPPPHGRRPDVPRRTRDRGVGRGTSVARLYIAARRRGYK
jgi:hypothetical protein